jgi:hypothetical protein
MVGQALVQRASATTAPATQKLARALSTRTRLLIGSEADFLSTT